jgi:hypothetical protein
LFAIVSLNPSPNGLPGAAVLQRLANGLAGWALVGALLALVIGAAMWALGSQSQNIHQSMSGRRTGVTAAVAAILIGAAPALINFFFATGQAVR